MKRKVITVMAAAFAMTSMMTAGTVQVQAAEKTTLNFYYWDEGQKSGMDAMIDLFEEQNSDIEVVSTIIPWSEYWTKLQTSLPNGTGPDVFWMNLYSEPYIKEGLLYDLSDAIEADGVDLSVFPESVMEAYTVDGHVYGIPKDYDGYGVFYNKAIFDEMGVDYPQEGWTWDDLLETAVALTDDVHYGYASTSGGADGYRSFILSNGGAFVTEDKLHALYNSAESVEALQFLHDLMYVQKCSPTEQEMIEIGKDDMFVSGLVAMVPAGSWKLTTFEEALGEDLGIVEMPQKVNGCTPTSGLALSVCANSKNIDAAVKFVEFAATKEAQDSMAPSAIPANADSAEAWLALHANCEDAHVLVDSVNESVSNPVYGNGKTQEGEQVMSDAIATVWMDENADIQAAMDQVVADLDALIAGN